MTPYPHCDARVLHASGLCQFCDGREDLQEVRLVWGINFTGQTDPAKLPCPADYIRGGTHQLWGGNRAGGYFSPQPEVETSPRIRLAALLRRWAWRLSSR